jgi:hypothetical protein
MTDRVYVLRQYDDKPASHILCEKFLPVGEMCQMNGYLFVPPELAADLGEPDDAVTFGAHTFGAWRMDSEMRSRG